MDGNDFLDGRVGDDIMEGGAGNDQLEGGAGGDILDGGAGFDYAKYRFSAALTVDLEDASANTADAARDVFVSIEGVLGSTFDDIVYGSSEQNDLAGLEGRDELHGRAGSDNLQGGTGDDILEGGAGGDRLVGGEDIDLATYVSSAAGVIASMQDASINTGDAVGDSYDSIEGLVGSAFLDQLIGDSNSNTLLAIDGNDYVEGRGGDDILIGGEGNDQLSGGLGQDVLAGDTGFDYARYVYAAGGVVVDLGELVVNTGEAAGDVLIDIEGLVGSAFSDHLYGDDAVNDLAGGAGDDSLDGGAANDVLNGGTGNDVLNGAAGADRLTGGAGHDLIVFSRGEGHGDTVMDFSGNGAAAGDSLVFQGYGSATSGASFVQVSATRWVIHADDGTVHDSITFLNAAAVHASDYTFV